MITYLGANALICYVLSDKTLENCRMTIQRNRSWIDACELRIDFLDEENRAKAASFPRTVDIPVILTHRRKVDGGQYSGSEKQRKAELLRAMDGDFAYVDLEEDLKRGELDRKAEERGIKIIRSLHDFDGVPDDIYAKVTQMARRGDVAKAAVTPHSVQDLITLFNAERELKGIDKIIIGMGEYGTPTRVLYRRTGSLLTFCSETETAPGQLTAQKLKELYHADEVNERTAIYGIIGNPVHHSSSPQIHNPAFRAIKFNAVYVPFLVDSVRYFFMLAEILKMRGFSVTIPHKIEVLSYLGDITREVKQIGSCNTVVRKPGLWKGSNTDYYGFLRPIENDIDEGRIKRALVIGAGGASQAVIWALRNRNVKVTILNRTLEKAQAIAKMNLCTADTIANAPKYAGKVDLIVQTTSVGLGEDVSPIAGFPFTGNEICYDIIYKPKMTRFLKDAKEKGCTLHYGEEMLFEQGKLQFEAFTGYHYPKQIHPDI